MYDKLTADRVDFYFLRDKINDLDTSISYKSDRSELFQYLDNKANSRDLNALKRGIDTLHKNSKLIVV